MNDTAHSSDTEQSDHSALQAVLLGLGIGALVGAVVALLLAPQPGSNTRDDVARTANLVKDRAESIIEDLKKSLDEVGQKSKELVDGYKQRVEAAVEAGREAASEKRAELESRLDEPA
ncbi:MAG TPA: YtxH domain-containing protein [Armatimonadota bacterium]